MSQPNLLIYFALLFALVAGSFALILFVAAAAGYFHFLTRFQAWVRSDDVKITENAINLQAKFHEAGFHLASVAKFSVFLTTNHVWINYYLDKSNIILIALIEVELPEPKYTLNTWFPDNSLIETHYPKLENIMSEQFSSLEAVGSMTKVIENHLERVSKRAALTDQSPIAINSVEQILKYNKIYQHRYHNIRYRKFFTNFLLLAFGLGIISRAFFGLSQFLTSSDNVGEVIWILLGLVSFYAMMRLGDLKTSTYSLKKTAPKQ